MALRQYEYLKRWKMICRNVRDWHFNGLDKHFNGTKAKFFVFKVSKLPLAVGLHRMTGPKSQELSLRAEGFPKLLKEDLGEAGAIVRHVKRCTLCRDCTADEIHSAYRWLALQRHPDKLAQFGVSPVEATVAFQELAAAYEVFSDPHECACYSDTCKGYYKVYSDVFKKIYRNEISFAKKLGLGLGLVKEAPEERSSPAAFFVDDEQEWEEPIWSKTQIEIGKICAVQED
ncbi:hypothetical protein RJ639_018573 [Escallonia herrerae]|uniref:J domain-containing protein n=1 Tax=Escallonia herrerae TaxID=1293975 RepID=A0AA88V9Z5_9ASTE|nr:hypothetical protein RJ639_018573 [Escallonia herrerae]